MKPRIRRVDPCVSLQVAGLRTRVSGLRMRIRRGDLCVALQVAGRRMRIRRVDPCVASQVASLRIKRKEEGVTPVLPCRSLA